MKCRFLMPYRNDQTPETLDAVADWPSEWNGIEFEGMAINNSNLIQARNDLLWGGRGEIPFDDSVDLYLFWDSDVVGTIDDFAKMIALDSPVVFGLYPFNNSVENEGYFVGGRYIDGFPGVAIKRDWIPLKAPGVYRGVEYYAGLGFTLIRKEVLNFLEYPWIQPRLVEAPPSYRGGREMVFDDIGFCLKLCEAGIEPVLDGRLNLRHIGRVASSSAQERPQDGIPAGIHELRDNMDAEAMAAIGVVSQMAERIKVLSEQNARFLSQKHPEK